MRNYITVVLIFLSVVFINAQSDFSDKWEDMYSYNNVVDLSLTDTHLFGLSDNALFIYDKFAEESEKLSSVNGLSGETTSAFYYDQTLNRIIIGYENGLVEVIDENRVVTIKPDILNFDITGSKRINDICANGSLLFLAVPFGIVTFDLETINFVDTFFIGNASSEVFVNEIEIDNNTIYAATENGIYTAALNDPFLIDSNNWTQYFLGNYSNISSFNNQIFVVENQNLYRFENNGTLSFINSQNQGIIDLSSTLNYLTLTTPNSVSIYNTNLALFAQTVSEETDLFPYIANTAQVYENDLYIGSENFGVLKSNLVTIEDFEEIHPEGPLSNQVFSISLLNDHLWAVYGGYGEGFAPRSIQKGASHFNGEKWITIPYNENAITELDLVHVSIDPFHENRVYISSFQNGMLVIENDEVIAHWDETNTALESIEDYYNLRISDSVFDEEGNLWITNVGVQDRLKKYSSSSEWSSYNISSLYTNNGWGMESMIIDKSDNIWIGTQASGAWVVSKNIDKLKALTTNQSTGNLPNRNVRALAVDDNNTVWIGTREGLVTFNSSTSFFDQATYAASPVVIASGEDDGFGIALLGIQKINTICVDGANNKWFGTDTGGVLYTNPSGKETFLQFDKSNSPLPSNKILKIEFDNTTGKVFFATDKGIVSYKSSVAPYGAHLEEVYAYPNPVLDNHDFVTIDGRKGSHLPNGTNVKIIDAAGKLVYETNVVGGLQPFGGKVVWNKTNLAGNKVASGIYIVLLTTDDVSETAMTKIAIIN